MLDKEPNVSGLFYTKEPKVLSQEIETLLSTAAINPSKEINMILVPHAGYMYSAEIAAAAFKACSGKQIKTVLILAPSHFSCFKGIAIWPEGTFTTPLGRIVVNKSLCRALLKESPYVQNLKEPFEKEHSLEVELPFVQKTFPEATLVPLLTGQMSLEDCECFATSLKKVLKNSKNTLIIISSDFSHFHNESTANLMDETALSLIEDCNTKKLWEYSLLKTVEMCGIIGTTIALFYAEKAKVNHVTVLKKGNSSKTTLNPSRVVGYAAVAFQPKELNKHQKKTLLSIARATLENTFQLYQEKDLRLCSKEGVFVTLYLEKNLRGCMGEVFSNTPLYETVHKMTLCSASDSRFPPLTQKEKKEVKIEISLLSTPKKIESFQEIKLGTHGVIIIQNNKKGLFLPQVATETGWSLEELLSELCVQKANLPPLAWQSKETSIYIFSSEIFGD